MILVELALQGVKGFPEVVRMPFKTGVNLAFIPEPQGRRVVLDLIYHCLYPDPSRGSATSAHADPGADAARAALTFYGRDQVTYRVIRELVTGAVKLYRFDADAKKYRLFTASAAEAAQYVRVQQQLPDEVSFERLFLYAPEAMPSRGEKARTRSGAGLLSGGDVAPSGPGLPPARFLSGVMARSSSVVRPGPELAPMANPSNALVRSELALEGAAAPGEQASSLEDKQALLQRLRADLDMVTRANRAQQEIDQLNARKFEISERAEGVAKLVAERTRLKAELEQARDLEGLPPHMEERLRTFEERAERFRVEEAKTQDELMKVEQEAQQDQVLPLSQDRYFLGAVGVGVFSVVVAATVGRPLMGLVNIPAAMVAVGAAFRYVSDLERQALRGVRRRAVEERLDRLFKQHELDTGVTRRLMEKLEVDSPTALLERVAAHNQRLERVESLSSRIASLRGDDTVQRDERELMEISARLEVLEAEVMGASGALHGAETLRRRVEALERELGPDVPPRLKSPPLGIAARPPRPRRESSVSVDLTNDLVAQSTFSSHLGAASPLAEDQSGLPSSDLPFRADDSGPNPSAPPSGLVVHPRAASRAASEVGRAPRPGFAGPASGAEIPAMVRPAVPAPSAPGLPNPGSGPVVPAGPEPDRSMFDFGGSYIGSADDEEDPKKKPGGRGGSGGVSLSGEGLWAIGAGGPSGGRGGVPGYGGDGEFLAPDRSRDLVGAVVDYLAVEVDALGERLSGRLEQYLEVFTEGRIKGATLGPRGEVILQPKGSDPVPYPELPLEELDAVDLALRFALAESILRRFRVPILIDDPICDLGQRRRRYFGQMLSYFAQGTQLVVATGQDDLPGQRVG